MFSAVAFSHAFADQTRWRIASLVAGETLCVCELVDGLRLPQSTLSSHLSTMRAAGVVEAEKIDKWVYYRLAAAAQPLFQMLRKQFANSPAEAALLKLDRERTAARVALRGQSDCAGPRRAIPPKIRMACKTAGC